MVNPARAGMIPRTTLPSAIMVRKPRASGDDPCKWEPVSDCLT